MVGVAVRGCGSETLFCRFQAGFEGFEFGGLRGDFHLPAQASVSGRGAGGRGHLLLVDHSIEVCDRVVDFEEVIQGEGEGAGQCSTRC
jgi:hypothetical protein